MSTLECGAQAAGFKAQAELAMRIMDGCLGMAAEGGKPTTRKAAQILAAVGGDAVNRELMRRQALKLKHHERQRIVEAVPAIIEDSQPMQVIVTDATQSTTDATDRTPDAPI